MAYDKKLLESWAKMEGWGMYLDRNGGLNECSSKERFHFLQKKYFTLIEEGIIFCKKLIGDTEDAFIFYVLAELYDRYNLDESPQYLFKRHVRYYASKALAMEPQFVAAKELLQRADEWIALLGGNRNRMPDLEVQC